MNKALILLLVTLVQSQSNGVILPNPNTNDIQTEEWENSDSSYPVELSKDYETSADPYKKRSITSDAFTRRSALDKNFMRFGRGDDSTHKRCTRSRFDEKLNFFRFGRGLKDNFIRFGRGKDNFIRFGRGGGKDGFIRFGRTRPDDFFRAGKSVRENFIRFGKADKNFMRFGRDNTDEDYQEYISSDEPFDRLTKSRSQDNFMRFGKSGKNGTNFLRFGKSESEDDDAEERTQESKQKESKRKKREVEKRSTGFFDVPPENFPRRIGPTFDGSWQNLEDFKNFRLTPFFPVSSSFSKYPDVYIPDQDKRNQDRGSNFIRFG